MIATVAIGRIVPPEVSAAAETLGAARSDARGKGYARVRAAAFYLCVMLVGCLVGTLLSWLSLVSPSDKDFWRACLTAVSILSGFMIATMVFTGKIEVAKSLSLGELRDVSMKANYLLLYQFWTLLNHFACLILMLLIPAIESRWPPLAAGTMILAFGLFAISLARSILVPLQIIELHRLTHAALLRDKRDELAGKESL